MNESHPWRDGVQTALFVLAFPVVLFVAYVFEYVFGWLTYGLASAQERRRQRLHVVVFASIAVLLAGIGVGDPTLVLMLVGAFVALLVSLELGHGAVVLSQRVTGRPRQQSAASSRQPSQG